MKSVFKNTQCVWFLFLLSAKLWAADMSVGYRYSQGDARFGLPVESQFKTQALSFSLQWEEGFFEQDAFFEIDIPRLEMTGPAALLSIIPLQDFVRLDRERRIRFLQLLDIYSLQDIKNFQVSGTSDVTLAAGTYFTDPWFDDYSLALSLEVKWDNGDQTRGLGTGDKDYTLRLDYQYLLDQWTPELSVGHVKAGDIGQLTGESFWFTQAGLSYQPRHWIRFGASYFVGHLSAEKIAQWDYSVLLQLRDELSLLMLYSDGQSATALNNNWSISLDYAF